MTVLPTSKGAREIEILRHKMEEKIEEIEAGYDCLIEMQPDDERKYLEKKAGISDEAIQAHARILPALAKFPTEVTVNRTHQGGEDRAANPDKRKPQTREAKTGFLPDGVQKVDSPNKDLLCSI